jgi:hypothetical protein
MYNDTLAKRGIKTAGPKKSDKNIDLVLPPIASNKLRPPASKLSKTSIASKKASVYSRTEKMGSGLS